MAWGMINQMGGWEVISPRNAGDWPMVALQATEIEVMPFCLPRAVHGADLYLPFGQPISIIFYFPIRPGSGLHFPR